MSLTQHISLYTLIYMDKEERHNLILETLVTMNPYRFSSHSLLVGRISGYDRKDLTELESANKLYRSHAKPY